MVSSTVNIRIVGDSSGAKKAFRETQSAFDSLQSSIGTGAVMGASFAVVNKAIEGVGAAIGGAVSTAMDYSKVMSSVGAVSGATASELAQLDAKALQLGRDTSFSAKEAAQGIEDLIKGGLSIGDVLGGGAESALNLAAAGSVNLAEAAEIAANAVGQFGLKGKDLPNVANQIAGAAKASSLDVRDFSFSMKAAGAVAHTIGFNFNDLAQGIAVMGEAGIKGSDAGTSLKTMMLNLQPTTQKQEKLFRQLGIVTADGTNRFFDAAGSVKSLAEVSDVLQGSLKGMSDAQRIATLNALFGSDAIRAGAVLSEKGAEGLNKMAASMGKVTAEGVGKAKLDNLVGSLEQLKGSAETAAIVFGRKLEPGLRVAADAATGLLNDALPQIENFGSALGDGLSRGLGTAKQILDSFKSGGATGGITSILTLLGIDPAAAAGIATALTNTFQTIQSTIAAGLAAIQIGMASGGLAGAAGSGAGFIAKLLGLSPEAVSAVSTTIANLVTTVQTTISQVMAGFQSGGLAGGATSILTLLGMDGDQATQLIATVQSVIGEVVSFIQSNLSTILPIVGAVGAGFLLLQTVIFPIIGLVTALSATWAVLSTAVLAAGGTLGFIVALLGGPITLAVLAVAAVVGVLAAAWINDWGGIQGKVAGAWAVIGPILSDIGSWIQSRVIPALGEAAAAFGRWASEIATVWGPAWENIKAAATAVLQELWSRISTTLEQIRVFWEAHHDTIFKVLDAAWQLIKTSVENSLTLISGIIKAALQLIGGDWEGAWNTIKKTGLTILDNFRTGVIDNLGRLAGEAASAAGQIARAIVDGIGRGLSAGIGTVQAKAAELAAAIPGPIKAMLGISSPSKVGEELGYAVPEGLVVGMENGKEAVRRKAAEIPEAIQAELDRIQDIQIDIKGSQAKVKWASEDIKQSYEDQLEPLQRQLKLLDLQGQYITTNKMDVGSIAGARAKFSLAGVAEQGQAKAVGTGSSAPIAGVIADVPDAIDSIMQSYTDQIRAGGDYLNDSLTELPDALKQGALDYGRWLAERSGYEVNDAKAYWETNAASSENIFATRSELALEELAVALTTGASDLGYSFDQLAANLREAIPPEFAAYTDKLIAMAAGADTDANAQATLLDFGGNIIEAIGQGFDPLRNSLGEDYSWSADLNRLLTDEAVARDKANSLLAELGNKLDQLAEKTLRLDRGDLAEIGRAAATSVQLRGMNR